jgi:putative toxin-antitoxin system antitoxin component (TIGR02293 family)
MSQILAISESTYQRRIRAKEKLTIDETEKVIALSEVYERGLEVFENQEDFQEWLNSRILSLQQHSPVEFLDTVLGRKQVMRVLNAILHGIYL